MDTGRHPAAIITPHLMFGLLILLLGVVFALDNLDVVAARRFLDYWPVGLILIGAAKLWEVQSGHGRPVGGILFIAAGGWLLLDNLDLIDVSLFAFWPVLLIIAGAVIVVQGFKGPRTALDSRGDQTVSAIAVMSGVNRGSNTSSFRGGELAAFMGGCEIDLRQAAIHGEAVIDVFAMWGGIEIRVPENWTVIGRVMPLMGGFDDTTRPPKEATDHRLIVRGVVLMGGVEVKN
ncbi:MAG: DUF5668 domain-containing protein [Vicinamibacterales bacterium]